MASALALGRARSDIDVISRAGLPLASFMDEATAALSTVIPFVAGCLSTMDPATSMVSSGRKIGDLADDNANDFMWTDLEYGRDDPTAMAAMAASGRAAVGLFEATSGAVELSPRMAELLVPHYAFQDEARVVFTDRAGAWGSMCLFRSEDQPFSSDEIRLLADLAPTFTRGIRAGLLAQVSRAEASRDAPSHVGPAVIIVDARNGIVQSSPGAQTQLNRMAAVPGSGDPLTTVYALVGAARRYAAGDVDHLPRVRLRTSDGVWLVIHAAPLGGLADRAGDVVVTIEEARPQEVLDLVAAAFGLTDREREVVMIVLKGADTREIAATMHVSPYTVQDHLKSIFDKAGVASRRELVARVYADQYGTRMGSEIGTHGWFVDTGSTAPGSSAIA